MAGFETNYSPSELIDEYMYHRDVLGMHTSGSQPRDWEDVDPNKKSVMLKEAGIDPDDVSKMEVAERTLKDSTSHERTLQVYQITTKDDDISWLASATHGGQDKDLRSFGQKVHIEKDGDHYASKTKHDITVSSKASLYPQQTHGIHSHKQHEKTHDKEQLLVYATGTGKSFVIVTPAIAQGEGIYVVPDATMAKQLKDDIKFLDEDLKEGDIRTSLSASKGQEAEHLDAKHLIITKDDLERFTPHLQDKTLYLDEAHLIAPDTINQLLEQDNTVLAVTATPTRELNEIFGEAIAEINMNFALEELKAFRKIETDLIIHAADSNVEDRVLDLLADYYGKVTFLQEDNLSEEAAKNGGKPRFLDLHDAKDMPEFSTLGPTQLIDAVVEHNELRRSETMNMAFSKSPELIDALTKGYQGVFDGTYERMDELAERVTEQRTEMRIKETLKLETELLHPDASPYVPNNIDLDSPDTQKHFAHLIEKSTVTAEDLQDEAQTTLKQQIANNINRQTIGLLRENTPTNEMRKMEINGQLEDLLDRFSGTPDPRDTRAQRVQHTMEARDDDSPFTHIAALLEPATKKDDILADIENKDYSSLLLKADDIDLSRVPDAVYAAHVPEDDEEKASELAERFKQGKITHLVNDSKLVAGFSNPDVMSVQRNVDTILEDAVTRATQMLGRPIRAKDGVAFASEHVSENFDMDIGELGADRPFTFDDVLAPDFLDRAQEYMENYAKHHAIANDNDKVTQMVDAEISPQNTPQKDKGGRS